MDASEKMSSKRAILPGVAKAGANVILEDAPSSWAEVT